MRLGDLAADRKPEPGILPEALRFRPISIETFKDPVDILCLYARAVILDVSNAARPRPHQPHGDLAAVDRDEGARILDQVGDDLAYAQIMAVNRELCLGPRLALDDIFD